MSENKIQTYLSQLKKVDGVYVSDMPPALDKFESFYLGVRKAEKRLLSDEEVAGLPILNDSFHSKEWEKRARSSKRLGEYFHQNKSGNLLDLGCGNGWFTALLGKNNNLEVLGMEVNLTEVKQAARVFHQTNLSFIYGDIFMAQLPENSFDFITINAVIQYFEDLDVLINRLFEILKPNGEIHFIDSPFYSKDELAGAKARTVSYYNDKGFPEMSQYYFHHSWDEISKFDPKVLYDPKLKNWFMRYFTKPDIPFPWIKIIKRNG